MKSWLQRVALYGFIGMANALVGLVFFLILTPAPTFAEASDVIVKPRVREAIPQLISGKPKRLVIPSLDIDLKVATGAYNPNTSSWTLGDTKAYYANVSVPANNSNGTTLIYGHAKPTVFEALPRLAPKSTAQVYIANYVFNYRLTSKKEVAPTDIDILTEKGPPRLALQTCTGMWYQYRTLFIFKFIGVQTA